MQYKVPQNVDIEDKVIAGLTLRQFMFLMIAGGIVLVMYFLFNTAGLSFLFMPCGLVVGGIGIAFAFVKINDRPFELFIVAAAKTLFTPGIRIWRKDTDDNVPEHTETKQTREEVREKKNLRDVKSSLERLASVIDSGGVAGVEHVEGRKTNVKKDSTPDAPGLEDVLDKAEKGSVEVDKYLTEAKDFVDKSGKEPTVGAIQKVQAQKSDFKYDKLELANEDRLEKTLARIEEKEKKLDAALESAQIESFRKKK